MSNLTFQELKSKVSIIDVATYLGYQLDKSKGVKYPSYVLSAGKDEVDRIYITNPTNNSTQGFWRRSSTKGGDVISFVREQIERFNVSGYNDIDRVNTVLHNFANSVYTPPVQQSQYQALFTPKPFDENRWEKVDNSYIRDRIFASRGIDRQTSMMFSQHIQLIKDKNAKNDFVNLGFPYRLPGDKKCVGYEIRGIGGFKSKASGTDSTNGMWIADFTQSKQEAKNIFIAESAFDAIAFYQIHRNRLPLMSSVFVSFGGSFSDQQFKNLTNYYTASKPVLLFDDDLYGKIYDIRAFALMLDKKVNIGLDSDKGHIDFSIDDKNFSLTNEEVSLSAFQKLSGLRTNNDELSILKPKGNVKDWNEQLQLETETASKYTMRR